jgi:hypothetical protein
VVLERRQTEVAHIRLMNHWSLILMATISNAALTITTDRPEDRAHVVVSCDVQFTEVEVNAMNMLGLQYTLHCNVLNKEMLDEDPVVSYHHQTFPRTPGEALRYEHGMFDSSTAMSNLHERMFGKDRLVAELKLKNEETGSEVVQRTEVIEADLAA